MRHTGDKGLCCVLTSEALPTGSLTHRCFDGGSPSNTTNLSQGKQGWLSDRWETPETLNPPGPLFTVREMGLKAQ